MFNKTSLLSVSVTLPPRQPQHTDNLILSGLKIDLIDDRLYSEMQELNTFAVNSNDYGYGKMNIELCFEPITESYCEFWANCISIRTDTLPSTIKINANHLCSSNSINNSSYTKISSEGKLALGIMYYFGSNEEREKIENSNSFLIEGFIALGKRNNVYGFMCAAEQNQDIWHFAEGMTNRPYNKVSIESLIH